MQLLSALTLTASVCVHGACTYFKFEELANWHVKLAIHIHV